MSHFDQGFIGAFRVTADEFVGALTGNVTGDVTGNVTGNLDGGITSGATKAEINRACDVSARLVAAGGTLSLTEAAHDGKTILLDTASGSVVTLPAASGSGARFRFKVSVTATSNSHIVKVANSSDIIQGVLSGLSDDGAGGPVKGWEAGATADTIPFKRTTTGTAKKGHWIELEDIAANLWAVSGQFAASGAEATPFSATV